MLGLPTALSVVIATVGDGLGWDGIADRMSTVPARIGRMTDQGRPIAIGEPANLTLVDPDARWIVRAADFPGPSRNCPYEGMELPGKVVATFYRGTATVLDGELQW